MPRHRTLKSLFIDMVVFVGMFSLLGHLYINFWERFVIQKELTSMKTSLHSLKDTIHRIGYAYDSLHQELLGLAKIAEKKQTPINSIEKEPAPPPQSKKKQCLEKVHDKIPVEVMKKTNNHTTLTAPMALNKTVQYFTSDLKKNKTTQNLIQEKRKFCCNAKNMSTITRYPPKSKGVGLDTNKCKMVCQNEEYCKYKKCSSGVHQYCKDFECYNPVYNWKF